MILFKKLMYCPMANLAARRFENTVLPKTILHHAATTTDISLELNDDALETLSRDKLLVLSLREMHCIRPLPAHCNVTLPM